ncbi:MAG: low molecular weight protein arginine phosphatase [Persicimonas sp.]
MSPSIRIVFVCSGNICRSPLAEALAKTMLAERGTPAAVISAGTLGLQGRPAAANSVAVGAEIGLDLDSHRSQGVSVPLLRMADHIVVMAPRHENELVRKDPGLAKNIVRLWEYLDEDLEGIPDPVGKDIEAFRVMRERVKEALERWLEGV